jgi:hypothetical protein
MPRTRSKKPLHLEVTGLEPLPPTLEEWERSFIEPVLARLFEESRQPTADAKEARDGEEAR